MPNDATLPKNNHGKKGHVLIVERNPGALSAASKALRKNHYQTTIFSRRTRSSRCFSEYDLVLIEHPIEHQERCLRTLQNLRLVTPVPIIVLADAPHSTTCTSALDHGADDVICRPYLEPELVARVNAVLRRCRMTVHTSPSSATLEIEKKEKQVKVRGRAVNLTQREFELLSVLASQPGRHFSREEILKKAWGLEYGGDERRVDLYVSRIRAKTQAPDQEDIIRSIYGVGYRLEA